MPHETAATDPVSGDEDSASSACSRRQASSSATNAPVIDAQRVPPSACSTSQSTYTVRSPRAAKSTTPRSERPISRWISTERPSSLPLETSRCLRSPVDAGSIPYSPVTQPRPRPCIHFGTDSWTEAVQITRVSPHEMSAEPVAVRTKPGSMSTGRSSSGPRLWERAISGGPPSAAPDRQVEHDRGRLVHVDVLDALEGQLEEAGAERPKVVHVARAQEAVVALLLGRRVQLPRRQRGLDAARDRGAGSDERHLPPEHALDHRAD